MRMAEFGNGTRCQQKWKHSLEGGIGRFLIIRNLSYFLIVAFYLIDMKGRPYSKAIGQRS